VWIAELLDEWQPTVIKGNAAEIGALTDSNEVGPNRNQGRLPDVQLKINVLFSAQG